MDSPVPAAKMYGIGQAARSEQPDLADLVEQLDSDDAGVRSFAIQTLEHLTGKTLGYHQDDPAPARRAAIARWVDYLRHNEIQPADEPGSPHGTTGASA